MADERTSGSTDPRPEVATKAPQRSYEHMFLELKHRLADPAHPERYLLMYPNRHDGWTASLEADPLNGQLGQADRPLIEWCEGQTPQAALQRLLELRNDR